MKAFVTGGSGFVGGHLIRRLIRDGNEVAALARSESAAQRVETLGADAVRGSLADVAAMTAGMSGCDVVFHCAAHVGSWGDPTVFRAVNVDGTANVIEAAQTAGVARLVQLSTESVFLDGRGLDGIDETMPIPQRGHLSDYAASKAEAERLVIAANGPDLETVAVRPRLIWGPGDGTWLPGLKEKVDSGVFRWIDDGKYLGSTCHVDNVVEGMVLAAEKGQPGASYFITDGPPKTFREFVTAYLATVGVAPGDASVPGWLMRGVGASVEATWRILPLNSAPPLNRVEVTMVSHPMVLDDSKARTELGYRPVISVERGMAELGRRLAG
jgi:nucleoside-diphosphate-sugar epimerase